MMVVAAGVCALHGKMRFVLFTTLATAALSLSAPELIIGKHLIVKINSLTQMAFDFRLFEITPSSLLSSYGLIASSPDISISVSTRYDAYLETIRFAQEHPVEFITHGNSNTWYRGIDSQILTYLSSFGLIATLFFLAHIASSIYRHITDPIESSKFAIVALVVFCGMFLTNRVLDYYPVAIFFFLASLPPRKPAEFCRATDSATQGTFLKNT
jgi:hypothetical protein